jgi:L-threonylcarbamoyladenylate synthase
MKILPTHTREAFASALREAARRLAAGNLVALPTETVYGLGANALNAVAVEKIFLVKGRLARAFWPGPLTLVLGRAGLVPDIVTGGGLTVGVRCPSHPFARALIAQCGFPIAAPSANRSNELSPTTAEHVARSLGADVSLIVDGGPAQVGLESTVVDLTSRSPRVLRPGMITPRMIAAVLGRECDTGAGGKNQAAGPLRSPGMFGRHYAPQAVLRVWSWRTGDELVARMRAEKLSLSTTHILAHSWIPMRREMPHVSVIPRDAEAYARALYAELHRCDEAGAKAIIVEAVPEDPEWDAIRDRLRRAAC